MPDPRHMDATRAFAAWPSLALKPSRRLRLEPVAATVDLSTLLLFTAPALPNELDETGIAQLLSELQRCGETTVEQLLQLMEPVKRDRGRRAILWLLRVGLVKLVRH